MAINVNSELNKMSKQGLEEYIKKQGKLVNQNLRRIEKAGVQESSHAYKYIERRVFDAATDGKRTDLYRTDKVAYNLKTKGLSRNVLLEKARQIQQTRTSKTITVVGIKNKYKKMQETFNKNGLKLDMDSIGKMFELFRNENIGMDIASNEIIKVTKAAVNSGMTINDIEKVLQQIKGKPSINQFIKSADTYNKKVLKHNAKYYKAKGFKSSNGVSKNYKKL